MAYSVFSYHSAFRDAGMFSIYFGCSPQQNEAVMELVDAIIDDVRKNGVTPEELVKAKNQVKGSLVLSLESTSSRMSRIGKNELLLRREVDLDETVREIERVTQEDLLRTAQQIFTGSRAVVGMGPGVHGSSA